MYSATPNRGSFADAFFYIDSTKKTNFKRSSNEIWSPQTVAEGSDPVSHLPISSQQLPTESQSLAKVTSSWVRNGNGRVELPALPGCRQKAKVQKDSVQNEKNVLQHKITSPHPPLAQSPTHIFQGLCEVLEEDKKQLFRGQKKSTQNCVNGHSVKTLPVFLVCQRTQFTHNSIQHLAAYLCTILGIFPVKTVFLWFSLGWETTTNPWLHARAPQDPLPAIFQGPGPRSSLRKVPDHYQHITNIYDISVKNRALGNML